jgi:hypothetical protein
MKIKIICLLTVLLIGAGVASPNNYCGVHCPGKLVKQVTTASVKKVVLMVDDLELLPSHHFLNNF